MTLLMLPLFPSVLLVITLGLPVLSISLESCDFIQQLALEQQISAKRERVIAQAR